MRAPEEDFLKIDTRPSNRLVGRPSKGPAAQKEMENRDTRHHLLQVGLRRIRAMGYASTCVQEILDEADVPKGSSYHQFRSKEDFARQVLALYVGGESDPRKSVPPEQDVQIECDQSCDQRMFCTSRRRDENDNAREAPSPGPLVTKCLPHAKQETMYRKEEAGPACRHRGDQKKSMPATRPFGGEQAVQNDEAPCSSLAPGTRHLGPA